MSESRDDDRRNPDPVADLQRWLMRAGARSMANQVADNVRRTLGQQRDRKGSGDVWDTATTEPPLDEPPECQWCPVCQAARRLRESGPGLGAKLADAGGVLASVVQDAFSAVDQMMKTSSERPVAQPPAPAPANGATRRPTAPRQADTGQADGVSQADNVSPADTATQAPSTSQADGASVVDDLSAADGPSPESHVPDQHTPGGES